MIECSGPMAMFSVCAAQFGSQQHPVATEYLKYGKWDSKIQFKILLNCNYFKFK